MSRRMIFPLLLGLVGATVLVSLGVWQMQRLDWKLGVIAAIEARIDEAPVAIPDSPTEADDEYLAVRAEGRIGGPELHVLASTRAAGAGFRIIQALDTDDGRRILLDRGFVPEVQKDLSRDTGARIEVTGTLLWPDDRSDATPAPDLGRNIWFSRDIDAMSAALDTEPVLLVVTQSSAAPPPFPQPVTVNIRNDHLQYAITWFGLAAVWIGMTGYLLWRIKRRTD
ncbi:SURF1 family protein [Oceanomicrobium pacificus]|uniref:SURF1-like protein n=1 Tax=Oceanomicrobium pacificus TaxID=2692916 RepID=A0A6B0U0Z0_9RHOB|nr:SURF1 family protein [Oceanomicrobium pacificus]MXU66854.1 SURF1 family protein [Oceanomicrobium pacificus]